MTHPDSSYQILVAEDNAADVTFVREALIEHDLNCKLHVVRDGAQVIEFLNALDKGANRLRLDLMLLDIHLPRRDGEDILKTLRATEHYAQTPVIVMTSSEHPRDLEMAQRHAALHYFKKPSSLDEFLKLGAIVREILSCDNGGTRGRRMIVTGRQTPADFLAGAGEMGERIRAFDWTSTPLGAIESWPQSLKTSVNLILSSRHPMWIGWGPEVTFLYNDAYLHVLGPAKHPEALGRPASVVWAEIWDVCGPLADKVFQKGEATFVDDVRLFMDRGEFLEETFYSFSYSPIRDEFGRVSGLFCPSTDVTPKVLNARRLRTLSELAANALAEKTVAGACASTAAMLSRNPDDIPFALLYLADSAGERIVLERTVGAIDGDSATLQWPIAEVFRSEKQRIVSLRGIQGLPHGVADRPVAEAVVLPVASPGEHKPHGVLVAGVNPSRPLDAEYQTFFELVAAQAATAIQSAKQVEEEKKRADMLAELDHAKTLFFSNVSHEFRTPLTLMLGPLETLLAKPDALRPEDHEHLVIAHRNSLRLLKLVNSLLDFSRIEAGRVRASYVPTDLAALTANLASNFRSATEAAGLNLSVDCPPLPEPVYVDREMWEKIVLNLLSNAFKFTLAGTVAIRLHASGAQCVLTVSDTGIGIPEAELPHIFERFHRVESARGRTYEGTGIGLALVYELVQLHGGSISVSSRPGEGSTFTLTLPFGSAHLPADRVESSVKAKGATAVRVEAFTGEALTWVAREAAGPHARPKDRPRILLADDNADMREHVTRILGSEYDVVTADDGQQALEFIRQDPPDLLLTDVMMPGLDGFGLLREVRSAPETRMLPVIFVSARAGEEMRVEGLDAGADDYLVKPFTANELRARVGTHVQMAIARRQAMEREAALRAEAEAARDEVVQVLESITDAFIALDSDWRLTYVNAQAERITGMKREDMLGRSHWELYPEAVGTTVYQELLRVTRERVAAEFENYYAPWKRWFHVKAYPAATGGVSVFYEDITTRKMAEEALRQSEERFRGVFESSAVGVAILDLNTRFLQVNQPFCSIVGYTEAELRGLDCASLTHPEDRPAMQEKIGDLASGRTSHFSLEKRYFTKDGRVIWVENSVSLMRDALDRPEHIIALCQDVSARRHAENEMRRLNQDLEQFAYSASHDLQEPLRGVKIYTELLSRRYGAKLDGQALEFLSYVRGSASRMEMLIHDLLAYTQVTRLELPANSVDANTALRDTLADLGGAIQANEAQVSADPLPDVPVHGAHLKQLFQNLIGNAIKYRSPERPPVVHVCAESKDGHWIFSVADNGIGIEEEYRERIFGLFKRLHSGEEYAGTGIGLAICQRIVERYHGRIWVESEPGKGSQFFFTLPV